MKLSKATVSLVMLLAFAAPAGAKNIPFQRHDFNTNHTNMYSIEMADICGQAPGNFAGGENHP